ncbi:hypothetical protein SUGI_0527510 [Cryptomeria japonica]|nr:hypothetical protein SUGI_0527510 [Cryptomeria japonica]
MAKSYLLVFMALLLASAALHVSCKSSTQELAFTETGGVNHHDFSGSDQVHRMAVEEHLDYEGPGANNPPPHAL